MSVSNSDSNNKTQTRGQKKFSRRNFLKGAAIGAGLAPFSLLATSAKARRVTGLCASSLRPVLTAQDFSLLGFYDFQTNGLDTPFVRGLTHRDVNGDLRFLNLQIRNDLHEISINGRRYGDKISAGTRSWPLSAGIWSTPDSGGRPRSRGSGP